MIIMFLLIIFISNYVSVTDYGADPTGKKKRKREDKRRELNYVK